MEKNQEYYKIMKQEIICLMNNVEQIVVSRRIMYIVQRYLTEYITNCVENDISEAYMIPATQLIGMIEIEYCNYTLSHPKWYYNGIASKLYVAFSDFILDLTINDEYIINTMMDLLAKCGFYKKYGIHKGKLVKFKESGK